MSQLLVQIDNNQQLVESKWTNNWFKKDVSDNFARNSCSVITKLISARMLLKKEERKTGLKRGSC